MKFTIERRPFVRMVEQLGLRRSSKHQGEAEMKLSACAARVFVATSGLVAGHEALVLEDGECFLPGRRFLSLLKSYKGEKNLTLEIDDRGLRIGTFTTPVRAYSPVTYPPGNFQVFPVTDLDVLGPDQQPAQPNSRRPEEPPAPVPAPAPSTRGQAGPAPEPASAKMPDWQTGSDPAVEKSRIWQLQLTLFLRQPRELSAELHLHWPTACQLYDDGFLSFDPRPNQGLNEAQEAEFLLVGSIAAAGYDAAEMAHILHGLDWPYQYRPGRIYLDWLTRRWRLLPVVEKPDPEAQFYNWLACLAEEGDTATLEQLAQALGSAMKSASRKKPAP